VKLRPTPLVLLSGHCLWYLEGLGVLHSSSVH
jgi:hypothetical protein